MLPSARRRVAGTGLYENFCISSASRPPKLLFFYCCGAHRERRGEPIFARPPFSFRPRPPATISVHSWRSFLPFKPGDMPRTGFESTRLSRSRTTKSRLRCRNAIMRLVRRTWCASFWASASPATVPRTTFIPAPWPLSVTGGAAGFSIRIPSRRCTATVKSSQSLVVRRKRSGKVTSL